MKTLDVKIRRLGLTVHVRKIKGRFNPLESYGAIRMINDSTCQCKDVESAMELLSSLGTLRMCILEYSMTSDNITL